MARLRWTIEMERRPCMVRVKDGSEKKALWYMFGTHAYYNTVDAVLVGQSGGQVGWESTVAVVEYEDGKVDVTGAENIRFLDSEFLFKEYKWGEEE